MHNRILRPSRWVLGDGTNLKPYAEYIFPAKGLHFSPYASRKKMVQPISKADLWKILNELSISYSINYLDLRGEVGTFSNVELLISEVVEKIIFLRGAVFEDEYISKQQSSLQYLIDNDKQYVLKKGFKDPNTDRYKYQTAPKYLRLKKAVIHNVDLVLGLSKTLSESLYRNLHFLYYCEVITGMYYFYLRYGQEYLPDVKAADLTEYDNKINSLQAQISNLKGINIDTLNAHEDLKKKIHSAEQGKIRKGDESIFNLRMLMFDHSTNLETFNYISITTKRRLIKAFIADLKGFIAPEYFDELIKERERLSNQRRVDNQREKRQKERQKKL
jgi:hypothetical protein